MASNGKMTSLVLCSLALVLLIVAAAEGCDCDYHQGGCTISVAPGSGYKCKCQYKGAWTCNGIELQCGAGEACPDPGCTSQACCEMGGGDCGGYRN